MSSLTVATTAILASAAPADPPTELPPLEISAAPLAADDVTLRPYAVDRGLRSGRAIVTLKDALGLAPGVLIQDSFGGFEPPRLSIRGSGLQSAPSSRGVQFLLDGFPLTLADGSFNAALIDPQLVDHVEVFRGEAAARLAPAALGGAFNLRVAPLPRPTAGTDALAAQVTVEAGSFGGVRATFASDLPRGRASLLARGSFAALDGYREHSTQQRAAFLAKVVPNGNATLSSRLAPTFSVYHVRARYDVPGPLTLAAATAAPRSVAADVQRDQPRRESDATQLVAQTTVHRDLIQFDAGLSWLRTNDWFRQLRANGIADSQSDDVTFRSALTRRLVTKNGTHQIRLGTMLTRGWRELRRFRNDSGVTGPQFGANQFSATTAAVDLEAMLRFDPLFIATVGLNGLTHRREISDRFTGPTAATTTRSLRRSVWQPRAELLWTPRPRLTFFTAISRAVEPPTFDDLLIVAGTYPNLTQRSQPLLDQCTTTIELGARGAHGRFGWDISGYSARWDDEILRLADAQGLPRGAVNASPTRHAGLETAFHWQLLDGSHRLRLTTTATWSRFRFTDDPVFGRNRLAGAPPHLGSARLLYEHPRGFFAGSTIDWIAGATPVDHANRMHYGGHALTHIRLGWRAAPRPARAGESQLIGDTASKPVRGSARAAWTLFVEVRNVFDRSHVASTAGVLDIARNPAATAVFLPGPGRAFNVGLEWSR
ncbi:TonB-dependent receptor family protein [Opitutus terrae]|uniref:TonB-dependent receptor plug n=1 Tax=Opitutus terrae (strain DSM 11246 / JCM 15787 / PB90-1) TaxID=452637 RepID=B1ZTP1_OPITP|nr:TonB-dependent receptor [Opitutus terrae]ACB74827.1 TonB-dependent receptor plug [Opitutus terrae PB90-1]